MLPKKRTSIDDFEREISQTKNDFINKFCPELNDRIKRNQYFQDYEFPNKQTSLKKYWEQTLVKFFQHNYDGCIVEWSRISDQFHIFNTFPLCLEPIILKLWDEKQIILLKNKTEKELILPLISNAYQKPARAKSVGAIEAIARFFKKPVKCLTNESVVVHIHTFKNVYHHVEKNLPKIFKETDVLLEDAFNSIFKEQFDKLANHERLFILFALYNLNVIAKRIFSGITFVVYKQSNSNAFDHERMINAAFLEKKIADLEMIHKNFEEEIRVLVEKATKLKLEGKKDSVFALLEKKKLLDAKLVKSHHLKLLLQRNLDTLYNSKEEQEIANVLLKTGEFLKQNNDNFEVFEKNVLMGQEIDLRDQQLKDMFGQIADQSQQDLDYKLLDEIEGDKSIVVPKKMPKNLNENNKNLNSKKQERSSVKKEPKSVEDLLREFD